MHLFNPISTAPKDGTHIVLFVKDGFSVFGYNCEIGTYENKDKSWYTCNGVVVRDNQILGWIKLPGKQKISFICYPYTFTNGEGTLFEFHVDGKWDEDKLTLEEALKKYPLHSYVWIKRREG